MAVGTAQQFRGKSYGVSRNAIDAEVRVEILVSGLAPRREFDVVSCDFVFKICFLSKTIEKLADHGLKDPNIECDSILKSWMKLSSAFRSLRVLGMMSP